MKNTAKLVLAFMMLIAIFPMKSWAQQPYRQYADDGILMNFHEMDNVDYRVFLLYNLSQDSRFTLIADEEPGVFSISPSPESGIENLGDAFDEFYQNTYANFSLLSKMEISDQMQQWKSCISPSYFASITLDIALRNSRTGNDHCANSNPFCTTDLITFDAATSSQTADQLEGVTIEDGCIGSSYNPSWFYMRINNPGQFIIHLEGHDPSSGTTRDVDFCIWGPFDDPWAPCVAGLLTSNIIDCCFSASYTEDIYLGYPEGNHTHNTSHGTVNYHVPQTGEYYILMVTNYSRQPCTITFTKTDGSGPGTTDCGILPGVVNNDGPYCVGETINLSVNQQAGATYAWTGPNGFSSSSINPTRPNCTLAMAGTYTCTTSIGAQTTTASTEVIVYAQPTADFTATSVCVGNATQFTSTCTTNPSGQSISNYQWNFGDNQSGSGQNVTHTYAQPGTYQATLTVDNGGGLCHDAITKTVTVNPLPTASFIAENVCQGEPMVFTSTSTGDQINSYQWSFGDGQTGTGQTVSHAYSQAGEYSVTLNVQTAGSCTDNVTQNVTVYAQPVASATATPSTVIYGASASLSANAGTQGTFDFHWEPADMVTNPNSQTTQTVQLQQSQTYTVTITNPQGGCSSTAQVIVSIDGSSLVAMASADQTDLCDGESTTLHAIPSGGDITNYSFLWSPASSLNNASSQNPVASPELGNTTYTCHVSDGFTDLDVSVTIHVHPNVEHDIYQTICENESYSYFGQDVQTPGVYDHTLHTQYGCDSILHLHLDNWPIYETPTTDEFCQGDSYNFFGQSLTEAGIYYHTLQSAQGCDSTIKLNLIQNPSYQFEFWESTCQGGPGYNYNGQFYQPNPQPYVFNLQTTGNLCDSTIILHVEESAYNSKTYNISLCGTEYTWPSNGITYYESGVYRDTLQFEGTCDSTLVLNLELRPNYYDDVVESSCDVYRWKNDDYFVDMTFTESTVYTHHYTNAYGCESTATLYLTINNHDEVVLPLDEACDQYFWDPMGHEITYTDHVGDYYTLSGTYHRTYMNEAECDSLVTMSVSMEYTPDPTEIMPVDINNTAPHWVVTSSEFQINAYDFSIWDRNPLCHWDSIHWQLENTNVSWFIEPDETTTPVGKNCKLYVLEYVHDTVWIHATVYNRCSPEGQTRRYWFVCSFYDLNEHADMDADFTVIPNPNNGQMTLNFEGFSGKVDIKVYDMQGTLIDKFQANNRYESFTLPYNMKGLADGVYLFVATGKEGTVAKKVIIQR